MSQGYIVCVGGRERRGGERRRGKEEGKGGGEGEGRLGL